MGAVTGFINTTMNIQILHTNAFSDQLNDSLPKDTPKTLLRECLFLTRLNSRVVTSISRISQGSQVHDSGSTMIPTLSETAADSACGKYIIPG
jgi:hypothetical protein